VAQTEHLPIYQRAYDLCRCLDQLVAGAGTTSLSHATSMRLVSCHADGKLIAVTTLTAIIVDRAERRSRRLAGIAIAEEPT
jgi:hypothetical protein